jgi:hypothetical protein
VTKTKADIWLDFDAAELLYILNGPSYEPNVPGGLRTVPSEDGGAVVGILRKYVDAWIKSGVRQDGSEAPGDRSYHRVAQAALDRYSGTLDELMFANISRFFHDSYELKIYFPGAGDLELQVAPQKLEPSRRAHQQATLLVVALLLSDLRYRIAKCRYDRCGQYFFLKTKVRKKLYAHGLFCSGRCNRAVSAAKLTKRRRGMFNPTIITWAAELLRQQKGKPGEDDIAKRKLLPKLNARIHRDKNPNFRNARERNHDGSYIAVNWLTKHWAAIQAKVEEMSDAKR